MSEDGINRLLKREYGYTLTELNLMLGYYIEQNNKLKEEIRRLKKEVIINE